MSPSGSTCLFWLAYALFFDTAHNTHNRQTSMPPVEFEPTISAGERPKTYALDRAATGIGNAGKWGDIFRIQCGVNFLQPHLSSSDNFSLHACSTFINMTVKHNNLLNLIIGCLYVNFVGLHVSVIHMTIIRSVRAKEIAISLALTDLMMVIRMTETCSPQKLT